MKKNLVRLTEGDLHRIIKESVNNILKEYKNDSTRHFNNMADEYMQDGFDELDAKKYARKNAIDDGWEKRTSRHPYISRNDELETDRAISNFMDDKNDEWWKNGKNKIVSHHRIDGEGNEWDEDFVEGPINNSYKPSHNTFKKFMTKHNRPLDTRHKNQRR